MSAQVSPAYRELHSGTYQTMLLAKKVGTYLLLVLASVLVLFPLLFAFSLALQGETIAPLSRRKSTWVAGFSTPLWCRLPSHSVSF